MGSASNKRVGVWPVAALAAAVELMVEEMVGAAMEAKKDSVVVVVTVKLQQLAGLLAAQAMGVARCSDPGTLAL